MKVYLAGGSGVIGARLIPMLLEAGHEVIAMAVDSASADRLRALGADPHVVNAFDAKKVKASVKLAKPDAIINQLTSLPPVFNPKKIMAAYDKNNRLRLEGTRNLLDAARSANVKRFVCQSAGYWYEPQSDGLATESSKFYVHAPAPIGEAAPTMARVEQMVLAEDNVIGVLLRYGILYGPGTWYSQGGDLGNKFRKRMFPRIGAGDQVQSFVHIDDACAATVMALSAKASAVYNVVDDEPVATRDWAPVFAQAVGAKPPMAVPVFLARLMVGGGLIDWMQSNPGASNAKIKRETKWKPQYPTYKQGFPNGLS